MKKFWKKASAKAGFTLVELVVVIAVLAILAAVAYPAYTGYIQRANNAKAESQVSGLLVAIQSAEAVSNHSQRVESITVTKEGVITIAPNEIVDDKFCKALKEFATYITVGSSNELSMVVDFSGSIYDGEGNGIVWSVDKPGTSTWKAITTGD